MIKKLSEETIGNITIEKIKWYQGYLRDYMVTVFDKSNKKKIFNKENMTLSEANRVYQEQIKKYKLEGISTYLIQVENEKRKWTEKYKVSNSINANDYFNNMIDNFNRTLKPSELKRSLISIKLIEGES